jgi:hypothetical protein
VPVPALDGSATSAYNPQFTRRGSGRDLTLEEDAYGSALLHLPTGVPFMQTASGSVHATSGSSPNAGIHAAPVVEAITSQAVNLGQQAGGPTDVLAHPLGEAPAEAVVLEERGGSVAGSDCSSHPIEDANEI